MISLQLATSRSLNSSNEAFSRLLLNLKPSLENADATEIKKQFEKHIDSKRTIFQIKSVWDLIEVLLQLDVICEEYVDVLKMLVPDYQALIELIGCYEKLNIVNKRCSICELNLDTDAIPIPASPENATAPSIIEAPEDDDTQEFNRVIRYLSVKLGGDSWVHLARKLDVPEYQINTIKADHGYSSSERAYQMLVQWREVNTDATKEKLLQALGRGALIRQDLVRDIQKGKHKMF